MPQLACNNYKGNKALRCCSLVINFINDKKFTISVPHFFHLEEQKHFNPRIKLYKAAPENPDRKVAFRIDFQAMILQNTKLYLNL